MVKGIKVSVGLEIILLGVMTLRKYLQVGLPLVCFLWVCFGMCMCVQDLCEVYPCRGIWMFFVGLSWVCVCVSRVCACLSVFGCVARDLCACIPGQ